MSRSFLIRDLLWGPEGREDGAKEVGLDLTTRAADPRADEGREVEGRTPGADEGRRRGEEGPAGALRADDDAQEPSAWKGVGAAGAEALDGGADPQALPSGRPRPFLALPRAAFAAAASPSRSPQRALAASRSPAAASATPPPSPPLLSPRPQGLPALAHHAYARGLPGKGLGCGFGDVRRFLPVGGGGARPLYGPVPLMGAVPRAPAHHHHHPHYLWAAQYSSLLSALPLQGRRSGSGVEAQTNINIRFSTFPFFYPFP